MGHCSIAMLVITTWNPHGFLFQNQGIGAQCHRAYQQAKDGNDERFRPAAQKSVQCVMYRSR